MRAVIWFDATSQQHHGLATVDQLGCDRL